ncbi:MAG: hypothetical protein QNK11_07975 [Legionella sp.]|nr:hypothetical protein [Legionella sp.]
MNEFQAKINLFTEKLQNQTQVPLWAIADEFLIRAIPLKRPPKWGPRKKVLHQVMKIMSMFKLEAFALFFVGLREILLVCRRISIYKLKKNIEVAEVNYQRVFAGFGASSADCLYQDYKKESQAPCLRINWDTQEGIAVLGKIKKKTAILKLLSNIYGFRKKFKQAIPEISNNYDLFLTIFASNIGTYTIYQLIWKLAEQKGIKEIAFLAPSRAAFAATERQALSTRFLQHGLLGQGILFPKFTSIQAITVYEANYLSQIFSDTIVHRSKIENNLRSPKTRTVLLLSPNLLLNAKEFTRWARQFNLNIVIRPTIRVTDEELLEIETQFENSTLDNYLLSLEQSLKTWKPMFIVAWNSTGLATGLEFGCLPISLCAEKEGSAVWAMIYPMREAVLFWPQQRILLEKTINSTNVYLDEVERLQSVALV